MRTRRLPTGYPGLLVVVGAALLGQSAGPAAQSGVLKASAPALISPDHSTLLTNFPNSLILSVSNAAGTYVAAVFDYQFEVYYTINGMDLVVSAVVHSGPEATTYTFPGPLFYNTVYQ